MYPLSEGMFAPRNGWYVAAWSGEVTRTPLARTILDEPIVLYRTQNGGAVALDGRCPHRNYPLAASEVIGDDIRCGYHGLRFRPDGSCAEIPSQDFVPAACRVRAYPLVERWQWLWIWPGDPALADPQLIPDHQAIGLEDERFTTAGDVYHHVPARHMLLHDNLSDLTHIAFLHKNSFGADGGGPKAIPTHDAGPGWIESAFVQRDVLCTPFFAKVLKHEGRVNRRLGLKLFLPGLYVGGEEFRGAEGEDTLIGALRIYHAVTPATRHETHYFFALGHSWHHEDPEHATAIAQGLLPALREDIAAVSAIEAVIKHGGRPREILLKADHVAVRTRRMFEDMIRRENVRLAAA